MSAKIAGYSTKEWKAAGVVFCVFISALIGWKVWAYESPAKAQARLQVERDAQEKKKAVQLAAIGHPDAKISDEAALRSCQTSLKNAARDPETAVIPDVGWMKGGADWRFLWNEKSRMVRMKNGLGLEVGVIALCVVDEVTGKIKLLTLDGRQLIAPSGA